LGWPSGRSTLGETESLPHWVGDKILGAPIERTAPHSPMCGVDPGPIRC
jgi:hypothetical protein